MKRGSVKKYLQPLTRFWNPWFFRTNRPWNDGLWLRHFKVRILVVLLKWLRWRDSSEFFYVVKLMGSRDLGLQIILWEWKMPSVIFYWFFGKNLPFWKWIGQGSFQNRWYKDKTDDGFRHIFNERLPVKQFLWIFG